MSKFTPRKTAPSTSDKHWIKSTKGGLNECLEIGGGSCLPNCVGYAWGRFYELTNEKPQLSTGDAENWYPNTADGYKRSSLPKLGAVACWRKGKIYNGADGYGHVAIVEEIKDNGDIVCSNSAYGGSKFYMKTYSKSEGYNSGALTFQGFILPPVDFEEPSAPTKTVEEVAREVIRGEWGNGEERKKRLTEAGYNYDEVQAKVNGILRMPNKTTEIKVGDVVIVKQGAKIYDEQNLADFIHARPRKVTKIDGDKAVISYDGTVTVNIKDLELW